MYRLNLPAYEVKLREAEGKTQILDFLRGKYVALTPEEWVRQHFVHYLVEHLQYPQGLLANEITINLNETRKRCDSVLYDKLLKPRMIIEYKAPQITISQRVFSQITRYNFVLHVDYLIVTNGLSHYCCKLDYEAGTYHFLKDIPPYESL